MPDAAPAPEPWTTRIEMPDGVRLHALVWEPSAVRTAPDVLCVHGLASNALLWSGVARQLASLGHRVVAVDQRGHGRSDPSDALDWGTVTDDLVAVCSALGLHQPLVVGQSWGGNVVVELARRRPDVVRGIACVDGGTIELSARYPDWESCWAELTPPSFEGRRWEEVAALIATHYQDWPAEAVRALQAILAVRADGTATAILTLARHRAVVAHLWEHRPSGLWGEICVPVLLLPAFDGGKGDAAKRSERDAAIARGQLVRSHDLVDAHHDVHAHEPVRVVAALREALADGFFNGIGQVPA